MANGSNSNQENQSGWGGKRDGAGRPKGSSNKPKISDHITDDEVKALVLKAKALADDGNEAMLKFLLEQIYGKPRQNVGLDGGEDGMPIAGFTFITNGGHGSVSPLIQDGGTHPNNTPHA